MTLHADIWSTLDGWRPERPEQESLRHAFLGFVAAREDSCARSCAAGHITASALVLDSTGSQALLTLHPRVGRWIQLGGHCEPEDMTLAGAALREAREESGMDDLTIDEKPLHLDVHPIICSLGVPTRHFDVRFLIRAPAGALPVRSDESTDLRWWPVDGLPSDVDTVARQVELALERVRSLATRG
ncbi:MAG: NUDIX domain-containing protein [Pseudonocardiaceae bacterium]|nr:NUDIX domain-containing protein [Pseudonocardiaceae bacterium]